MQVVSFPKITVAINQFNLETFGIKSKTAFNNALPPEIHLDKELNEETKQKEYATVALCCLSVTNPFRMIIINLVTDNPFFDYLVLLVIVTNSIFMALNQEVQFVTDNQFIIDTFFLVIYTIEMVLRIIAMGFITREFSYMRNFWNLNDFIVVIFGWIAVVIRNKTLEAIKIIRILRLIRAANLLPNMTSLLQTIFKSMPVLFDIGLLFFFVLLMFGAVATQLLGGHFQNRCTIKNKLGQTSIILSENVSNLLCFKQSDCDKQQPVGVNSSCQYYGNPMNGTFSYDNIFLSVLNVFIIIRLEGSYSMMYLTRQSEQTYAYDAFYVLCIIIGCFVVLNLLIAVQADYLDKAFDEEEERLKELKEKQELHLQIQIEQEINQNDQQQSDDDNQSEVQSSPKEENVEEKVRSFVNKKKKCKTPQFLKQCSEKVFLVVDHRYFDKFIMFLIFLNTVVLAAQFYDSPKWLKDTTDKANITFMILFTCEMLLKIIGLGIKQYASDSFNLFDAFVVLMSYIDYYIPSDTPQIKMIRTFRLMRILKILRNWGQLANLISTVLESLTSIRNLGVLILLYLFIGALFCKYFFLDLKLVDETGNQSIYGFQNMITSLINVFIILTGANWNDIMIQTIAAQGNFGPVAIFVPLLIIGNIFLLNLFLGILLRSISNLEEEVNDISQNSESEKSQELKNDEQKSDKNQQSQENISSIQRQQPSGSNYQGQSRADNQSQNLSLSLNQPSKENQSQSESVNYNQTPKINQSQKLSQSYFNSESDNYREGGQENQNIANQNIDYNSSESDLEEEFQEITKKVIAFITKNRQTQLNSCDLSLKEETSSKSTQKKSKKPLTCCQKLHSNNNALFLISPENSMREFLLSLLQNSYFSGFIYHMIAFNSLLLALQSPSLIDQFQNKTIDFLLNFISGIFIVEFVIKVIAQGFYFGDKTYLKDPWNRLDFIIVFFCILGWIFDALISTNINFLKGLRSLRALRPLRVISSNEGMKIVVNALFESIPVLLNVLLIVILFVFVFAILGVQLLVGQLGFCNNPDPKITNKTLCTGNYFVDVFDNFGNVVGKQSTPMVWSAPINRYDNIFQSMMTFFEVACLENWVIPMFQAVYATGYDQSPIRDNNQSIALLFIFYIFFQTFFIMTLFVSVIIDKFNDIIKKNAGADQFNQEQKEWVQVQKLLISTDPKIIPVEPINKIRLFCFRLVQQKFFEYFLMTLICINSVLLLVDSYGQSEMINLALKEANFFFTAFFTFEAIIKILGYGFKYYWYVNWNKFDFIIVSFSLIAVDDNWLDDIGIQSSILRIIRIARLLKIIKTVDSLKQLLKTLLMSMTNIINTGALLLLILFTFSVAGMSLFGDQELIGYYDKDGNFTNFYLSMQLLFRTAVGGDWNGLMHDNYEQFGLQSIFFWLLFVLCVTLIFLNVFIAVIAESFNENSSADDEDDLITFKKKDIKAFQNTWARFCPLGEMFIKTEKLIQFLQELPPPLGYYGIRISQVKLKKIIYCLNIRDHEGYVYYPEVMWSCFHSIGGFNDEKVVNCEQVRKVIKQAKKKYKALLKPISLDSLCGNKLYEKELTAIKYIQAKVIAANWLSFKRESKLKQQQEKEKEKEINQDEDYQQNQNLKINRNQIRLNQSEDFESENY